MLTMILFRLPLCQQLLYCIFFFHVESEIYKITEENTLLFEGVTNINVGTVTRLSIQSICLVHASKESNLLSTVVDTLKPSVFQNLARSEVKKTVLLPKKEKPNKETQTT